MWNSPLSFSFFVQCSALFFNKHADSVRFFLSFFFYLSIIFISSDIVASPEPSIISMTCEKRNVLNTKLNQKMVCFLTDRFDGHGVCTIWIRFYKMNLPSIRLLCKNLEKENRKKKYLVQCNHRSLRTIHIPPLSTYVYHTFYRKQQQIINEYVCGFYRTLKLVLLYSKIGFNS